MVWCQAAIRGKADGRNQPMLLRHSTPPLQDAGGVPWIRWGNNFYFLLPFFTTFITFIILFLFSGTGPLIWFTARPCEEVELGELRSGAVLHEDKKGGTGCWDVSEATGSENCGLSATTLRWVFPQFLASNRLVKISQHSKSAWVFKSHLTSLFCVI